jgi:hypothetical protein
MTSLANAQAMSYVIMLESHHGHFFIPFIIRHPQFGHSVTKILTDPLLCVPLLLIILFTAINQHREVDNRGLIPSHSSSLG